MLELLEAVGTFFRGAFAFFSVLSPVHRGKAMEKWRRMSWLARIGAFFRTVIAVVFFGVIVYVIMSVLTSSN
jgi:hypothetical protein